MINFIKELPGRGGTVGEDSTRVYIFQSTTGLDSEYEVYKNRYCPKIGSRHPNSRFNLFYLKRGNLKITQGDGNLHYYWTVEAEYTQLENGEDPPQEEQDFNQPSEAEIDQPDFSPNVSIEFEDYSAPLEYALNLTGQFDADSPGGFGAYAVVNSALEKYNPPPEVFRQNAVIRVSRNLALSSSLWRDALDVRNTINTDSFTWRRGPARIEIKPKQSRIKIRIGEQQEYRSKTNKKKSYANLEVQFAIKRETWNLDLLDVGSVYLDTAGKTIAQRIADDDWGIAGGTKQLPITDDDSNRINGLLNGQGEKLAAGAASKFNRYSGYVEKRQGSFFKRITRG